MGSPNNRKWSDIFDILKTWIPWRSEHLNMSRDFWMPDHSCRMCYECDSQFSLFNRRHHCRVCGRVFCAKCTANSIPASSNEVKTCRDDAERIRVCNYCFRQWKQGSVAVDNGMTASNPVLSPFPSETSLVSTQSSCTNNSGSSVGSMSYSAGHFHHVPYNSVGSHYQNKQMNEDTVGQNQASYAGISGSVDVRDHFSDKLDSYCRSDDEEEDYRVDSESGHFSTDVYYNDQSYNDINEAYGPHMLQTGGERNEQAGGLNNDVTGDRNDRNAEPLDFENNDQLWHPPEPEDEEDEREALPLGDEEGGSLQTSGSFGAGEHCNLLEGHFRDLISQLLKIENLPVSEEDNNESWLDIITSLSWEAATLLKPDMSKVGGMDPGGYVKVKCVACGHRRESTVIKGIVCKKNVAHRRMTSKFDKPRFFILGGALEYQRISNHLSSFDSLLQQEIDHLKMAVVKICAHHPNVLLVEKTVSRFAQEYLLAKDISLVLNIKKPLLERIARCTGAQIVPSVDHLPARRLGRCDSFHVDKFVEEHGSAGQGGKKLTKTLMFFEGCPRPLGCTILLKGANGDELKKVKHVVHYGIFAAYHLALESSFLADEGASLPKLPLKSPINVVLPDKLLSTDKSISTISGFTTSANEKQPCPRSSGSKYSHSNSGNAQNMVKHGFSGLCSSNVGEDNQTVSSKQDYPDSASDHESILVSLTTRCIWKGALCERRIFRIKYYGSFDRPLGHFLRDQLFNEKYQCRICELPPETHILCYTHLHGSLTIYVRKFKDVHLPGERDNKIWMWNRCLRCPRDKGLPPSTSRVVMSDAASGLSLGKFLELSFFNHVAASRPASCGHSLHRDCLRFYGFGNTVARFEYAPIHVHSIHLPPSKLLFNYDNHDWIQSEVDEVQLRREILYAEVVKVLNHFADKTCSENEGKVPRSYQQISELEAMLHMENIEYVELLHQVVNGERKASEPAIDILLINRLRLQLIFQSYVWDQRLIQLENIVDFSDKSTETPASSRTVKAFNGQDHIDPDSSSLKDSRAYSSDTIVNRPDNADSSKTVRRVLSEGQFPCFLSNAWMLHGVANYEKNAIESSDWGSLDASSGCKASQGMDSYGGDSPSSSSSCKLDRIAEYSPAYILSFRDLLHQSGSRLLLPVCMNNIVIPVYDDEPTSVISYALASPDYYRQLFDQTDKLNDGLGSYASLPILASMNLLSQSSDEKSLESIKNIGSTNDYILRLPISRSFSNLDEPLEATGLHFRICFSDYSPPGKVKHGVTCYFAKKFKALRKTICPELDYIRSLSRCKKWGAQGGKSNVFFAKTLDDRFIIKQVTKTELESFMRFAPSYFKYLSESRSTGSPTCLAKILGIYQVTTKHPKGGKESKMDVLVMENLLYRRNIVKLYDLKGSSRSRYASGSNKVLLDQNLLESMPASPIFVETKAKKLLERAVWNDTLFLGAVDVMDYSMLVGVDEEKHELVLGIIDFMRQYTWDKHLETWVKASGLLGGPKNTAPTIISPLQYKKRFRKAMSAYFLTVPAQRPSSKTVSSGSQSDLQEENKNEVGDSKKL